MEIEIVEDTIVVPIYYVDEEHIIIDTEKIRQKFEDFISEMEEDTI